MQKRREKIILNKRKGMTVSRGISPAKRMSNTFDEDEVKAMRSRNNGSKVARTSWDSDKIFLEIQKKI